MWKCYDEVQYFSYFVLKMLVQYEGEVYEYDMDMESTIWDELTVIMVSSEIDHLIMYRKHLVSLTKTSSS